MKLLVLFPVVILFVIASCSPSNKYKAELNEIDSCLVIIDMIEADYNGIKFDSLMLMANHVLSNEDSIKKYYKPDTLSLEIGTRMNECKGIRKVLKNLDTKQLNFTHEIGTLRSQFSALKADVENGVLTKEKISQYLAEERASLDVLCLSVGDFYKLQEIEKKYYYSSVPFIDSLIVRLRDEAQE